MCANERGWGGEGGWRKLCAAAAQPSIRTYRSYSGFTHTQSILVSTIGLSVIILLGTAGYTCESAYLSPAIAYRLAAC